MPGEKADEAQAEYEREHLEIPARAAAEAVDQQPDADHLAGLEGVGEAEKCHRGHAPGGEVVAGRDVEPDFAPDRQAHHEQEDDDEEQAGEIAREEVEAIESAADHAARLLSARVAARIDAA